MIIAPFYQTQEATIYHTSIPDGIKETDVIKATSDQNLASKKWIVIHNLGYIPSVTMVDSENNQIAGMITYHNHNQLTVTFSEETVGKVFLF